MDLLPSFLPSFKGITLFRLFDEAMIMEGIHQWGSKYIHLDNLETAKGGGVGNDRG